MKTKVYSSSKNIFIDALKELKNQIEKDFEKIDFLLFALPPKFGKDVPKKIETIFQNIDYAGFHAISAFKDDSITEDSVTVAVFQFKKRAKVKKFYIEDIRNFEKDNTIEKTANFLNNNKNSIHIILAGLAEEKFALFLEKLSSCINYNHIDNIVGGISSGEVIDEELKTWQFIDGKTIKNGFIIISFENIKAKIGISLGFKPYGITYKITKAKDSKIYEVDNGVNFTEVAKRLLRGIENPDFRYLWFLPLNILDETDGYVSTLRTIEKVNSEYVKLFGPVKKGQYFKLSFATEDDIIEEDKNVAKKIKAEINPEIIFNFSCVAREYILGDRKEEEIKTYVDIFKTPAFGFFTFGEIGPDKYFKKLKLYNETSLLIGLKEND